MLKGFVFRMLRLKPATARSCIASVQHICTSSSWLSQDNSLVRRVKNLAQDTDERFLSVTWDDGKTNRYPFVYLRDICKCPECFHPSSMQRSFDSVAELHSSLVAKKVDIQVGGKQVEIIWPNEHVTTFKADWLYERRLPEKMEQHSERDNFSMDEGIQLGDHKMTGNLPTLQFHDIINSKANQLKWLELVHCHGIVLVKGAPSEPGHVNKLGGTLGYMLPMWYGETLRTENKVGRDDMEGASVSSVPQALYSYNEYRGGLHLVHCLQEVVGTGGEHTFVDSFNVAKQLKYNNPEAFRLLSTSNVLFQRKLANEEAEFDMKFTRSMISLDWNGRFKKMIYSDVNRANFVNAAPEEIPKLYRAYYEVGRMIRDPTNTISHKLRAGDIITFDCDRVFSGRNPFGPETTGTEVFESGFTDKDMTNSRRRTLKTDESGKQ